MKKHNKSKPEVRKTTRLGNVTIKCFEDKSQTDIMLMVSDMKRRFPEFFVEKQSEMEYWKI